MMFESDLPDLDASEVPLDIFTMFSGFQELSPNEPLDHIGFVPVSPTGPPSTKEFCTDVNFRVELDGSNTHKRKFLYSHKLNCLFLNIAHNFSVDFEWDTTKVVHPVYVRTTVVFSDPCDAEKRVQTCYQHLGLTDPKALPEHIRNNVLRSGREESAPGVFYCGVPSNADSWYSVLVRFSTPSSHAFHFVCMNSCSSGINRRPTSLVFTLESATGEVYGRQVVGVRVCGCPKRDMRAAELAQNPENPKGKKRLIKTESHSNQQNETSPTVTSTTPSRKRVKVELEDCDTIVAIPEVSVVGRRVALAGLRVMRDMMQQNRDVKAKAQQGVQHLDACIAQLERTMDAVDNGAHSVPQL